MRRGATLGLVLGTVLAPAAAQEKARPYDPDAGIDANGRVAKPDLPEDLPNPARWRYQPPGRLKPGDIFDRFLVSTFMAPTFFRDQDVGFGGGVSLTDLDFRNQDWRELANIVATYSEEGQQQYRIDWSRWIYHRQLDNGGIIRDERSRVAAHAEYSRTLTRRFYGLGSATTASDQTSYTEELPSVGVGVRLSVPDPGDDLLVSVGVAYQRHQLSRGRVSGVPSTGQAFPVLFAEGDDVDQLWVSWGISYDTRDSLHQPYAGWVVGLRADTALLQTHSPPGTVYTGFANGVLALPPLLHGGGDAGEDNPPTDVLALGGFVSSTSGDLPFYSLPTLGGSRTLRGYIQNRFTDRVAAHGSLEYRFAIVPRGFRLTRTVRIERIGLALFYDFGTVADDLGDLFEGKYLDSYGPGLRIAMAREATFRVDLGFSDEDVNLSLAFGNSF